MRGKHLTGRGVLGLALCAAVVAVVCSRIHPDTPGGPAVGVQDAALVVIAGAAWGIGRSRSGAWSRRRRLPAAREVVGEEVVRECDATGRFTHAGPQCLELLGHTPGWLRSTAVAQTDAQGHFSGLLGASHRVWEGPPPEAARTSAAVLQLLAGDALRTAFQPIVSLADGRVLGVEALARFTVADEARTTEDWFTDAAAVGLGVDLEIHAVVRALRLASALPQDAYVSVNLSPQALMWPGLPGVLAEAPVPLSRIVVELTEHSAVDDYDALDGALQPLRRAGLRIAVDDAGAGYATFRHILRLAPDLIKLDRSLIRGIDGDPARRALAGSVVALARGMHAVVVAEGVERSEERTTMLDLGVDVGQGYLLGRPSTDERTWRTWHRPGRPDLPTTELLRVRA